ncbi:MAG: FecR domain-containing protein [Prolixibacteraceae bacterium]|nr:FecR domain-containing protein [Prolixibacteraceae bacterium]
MEENINKSIYIGKVIGNYITGKETKAEKEYLESWLEENSKNKKLFENLRSENNLANKVEQIDSFDAEDAWRKYTKRIDLQKKIRRLGWWRVAAVIFFIIGIGGIISNFLYFSSEISNHKLLVTTVQTEKGQTSKVILPDSSVVWLNSATKLTYASDFSIENRNVTLSGEAYFDIVRNEKNPFIVLCKDINIRVLGTEFNVCSECKNNKVDVILDKGSIELSHMENKFQSFLLKPGERAVFNGAQNTMTVSKVTSTKYTSWKDGVLIFENDPMGDVIKKLENWYDITIDVQDSKVYNLIFNATIIDESIEDLFELMKYSCDINYKIYYSRNPKVATKVTVSLN